MSVSESGCKNTCQLYASNFHILISLHKQINYIINCIVTKFSLTIIGSLPVA